MKFNPPLEPNSNNPLFDSGAEFEKGQPPSIGPQSSMCGVRAVISKRDAKGMAVCRRCGLFHDRKMPKNKKRGKIT